MNNISGAEVAHYIDQSVLCWLATCCLKNIPNVSPKEIFFLHDEKYIVIANIASPQSQKNILLNPNVCVCFIDIFVQKGLQVKGTADVIKSKDAGFDSFYSRIPKVVAKKFPIQSFLRIKIESVKRVIAPTYHFFPKTNEAEQIRSAKHQYNL